MLRLRPFKQTDTTSILSWCQDETTFYQWTAGRLGDYPITEDQFRFNDALMPFVAFELYGAPKVSLGVFENNLPAYYCYKAAGFQDVILDTVESYSVIGEEWLCRELAIEKE